ncbi:hypothetical protein AB0O68_15630 [Streptomyces sp. NPDC087512]|uniref:hypothetical protein n=1 Tax=Streptomyces sp. NPDC087512 TaxID=3155059 RepID=UPI00343ACE0E
MTAAAGLVLALVFLAIVAAGLGLAAAAWRPGTPAPVVLAAGAAVGAGVFLLAALHGLAYFLTV